MKNEDDPVLPGEMLVRLVWHDYFKPGLDLSIQPGAFEPRKNETDGISLFRLACMADPRDALSVIAEDKREKYAIAMLPAAELAALGLTVQPSKIAKVPGIAKATGGNRQPQYSSSPR